MNKFFLIISGPTAVGKTELVDALCQRADFGIEIINADMGQLYVPLSIGTAKPAWKTAACPHHLFDVLGEPVDYKVQDYREQAIKHLQAAWDKNMLPVLVGGSGFYIKSLLFPPAQGVDSSSNKSQEFEKEYSTYTTQELWQKLHILDPVRAKRIHAHDRYRIIRAFMVWHDTGQLPSTQAPVYNPPGKFSMLFLDRDRNVLYERINERTRVMLDYGWIEEVARLSPEWHAFLRRKKLIGYAEILQALDATKDTTTRDITHKINKQELIERIQQTTRNYAKRQLTFWRSLAAQLKNADKEHLFLQEIAHVNLTLLPLDLYIEELLRTIKEKAGL